MKSFVVLSAPLACVIVACSGANSTELFDPVVTTPSHQPDASVPDVQNDVTDSSVADVVDSSDAEVDSAVACVSETNGKFCTRTNSNCTVFNGTDNCGIERPVVTCGLCSAHSECVNGKCCKPDSDLAVCKAAGYQCGLLDINDNCGLPRHIADCGTIPGDKQCDYSCLVNHQCCVPKSDAQFCAEALRVCGDLPPVVDCEVPRNINCGVCVGNKVCSPAGVCL